MTSLYICNMIFNITEREAVDHDNFAFSEWNKLYQHYYYRLLSKQNISNDPPPPPRVNLLQKQHWMQGHTDSTPRFG